MSFCALRLNPPESFPIMSATRRITGSLAATDEDRIRNLLTKAWGSLASGRAREAADAFGRVLLQRPGHPQARRGLEAARAAAAEEDRLLEVRVEEARHALEGGDAESARAMLEEVIERGGNRDHARALLDRTPTPAGRLLMSQEPSRTDGELAPPGGNAARQSWSRRVFAACCALVLVALAASVASSWERLMQSLVRAPAPHGVAADKAAIATHAAATGGGE